MVKIVEIEWLDACSFGNAWVSPDDVSCSHCKSVGYLQKKDKDKVVITQSLTADREVMNQFVIPRGCVKSIKELACKSSIKGGL